MTSFNCCDDDDTRKLLEIIAWCLVRFFGHSRESADRTVEQYYRSHSARLDDDFYHQERVYWMALRIHFIEDLQKIEGDFHMWRVANGYRSVPPEAVEYFTKEYFGQK